MNVDSGEKSSMAFLVTWQSISSKKDRVDVCVTSTEHESGVGRLEMLDMLFILGEGGIMLCDDKSNVGNYAGNVVDDWGGYTGNVGSHKSCVATWGCKSECDDIVKRWSMPCAVANVNNVQLSLWSHRQCRGNYTGCVAVTRAMSLV